MRLVALIVMAVGILGYITEFMAMTTTGLSRVFGVMAVVGAIIAVVMRRPGD